MVKNTFVNTKISTNTYQYRYEKHIVSRHPPLLISKPENDDLMIHEMEHDDKHKVDHYVVDRRQLVK